MHDVPLEAGGVVASVFAFECEYCGNIEMHRGQVPTALGAFGDDASRLQLAIDYLSKETA